MSDIEAFFNNTYAGVIPFVLVALMLLMLYKMVSDTITPFDDNREITLGNSAAALNRTGAYLGVVVAMTGSLIRSQSEYFTDLSMFALDGVIALVMFTLATKVFDWLILPDINNVKEIQQENMAVATTEASGYIALGFIMSAAFSGNGADVATGLKSALLFSFLGLATLVVLYKCYDAAIKAPLDQQIGQGNMSAAIDSGSVLLSMGIVLFFSISGDFTGWRNDLVSYFGAALVGAGSLVAARFLAKFLASRAAWDSYRDEPNGNAATAVILGGVTISLAAVSGFVIAL